MKTYFADGISGQVVREVVARGSKSEREAFVLHADDNQTYFLRRRGRSSFDDTGLEAFEGHQIRGSGVVSGPHLILDDIRVVD